MIMIHLLSARFCDNIRPSDPTESLQMVPAEEDAPDAWTSEPMTLDQLLELYYVENKLPGREPGTALLITSAINRKGEQSEMVAN